MIWSSLPSCSWLLAAFRKREAQCHVAECRLAAGVDDRLHRHAAHGGVHDEQPVVQELHRNRFESPGRALVPRAHDRDAVVAEVDVDALVRKLFHAKYAVGAAERVRDDRQPPRLHQQIADFQCFDRHHWHGHGPGRAAQHDRVGGIGLDPERLRQARSQGGMARAGGEHEAIRPFAVDRYRRPDAADPVTARGRDEARFVPDYVDVVEGHGLDLDRPVGRRHPDVLGRAWRRLGLGEQHQKR